MNLIRKYLNYRALRLVEYGKVIIDTEDKNLDEFLTRFCLSYVDAKYYDKWEIEDCLFNDDNLSKLFDAIYLELFEDNSDKELFISNSEYKRNIELLNLIRKNIFDIVLLDDKLESDNKKINSLIKISNNTYNSFKNMEDDFYKLNHIRYRDGKINYTYLKYDIDSLSRYKVNLVNNVYKEDIFDNKKLMQILNKLSILFIKSDFNINTNYIIDIKSTNLYRGKLINEIANYLDDDILRKYIFLKIDYKLYRDRKEYFDSLGYRIVIDVVLFRTGDAASVLADVIKEEPEEIFISKYRNKDIEYINKYTYGDKKLLILEEDI